MKILVTGATGYVGRALIPTLERLYGKENITALDSKTFSILNDIYESLTRKQYEQYNPSYTNVDFIIHLAVKTHAGNY